MAWTPFLVAAGLGLGLVCVPAVADLELGRTDVTSLLRFAMVFAGLGVAFLLDDPAVSTTSIVPTPRALRQGVRLAVAVSALAAWWGVAWWITAASADAVAAPPWMLRGLTVEAAAIGGVAFGLASTALRRLPDGGAGVVAAPALLVLAVVAAMLTGSVEVFVPPGDGPGDGSWHTAHHWWAGLLAGTVIAVALASRDLGRSSWPASAATVMPVRNEASG
jgi:hypothetical protein